MRISQLRGFSARIGGSAQGGESLRGSDGEQVFSLRRNPYWCDKCPLLSAPLKKLTGVFKGQSEVKPVAEIIAETVAGFRTTCARLATMAG